MRSGIRLTVLDHGDNLLGLNWNYQGYSNAEAIKKKLSDLFYHIDKIGFTDVIDTIHISKSSSNELYIADTGVNGDKFPFVERMEIYHTNIFKYNLNMICEVEVPTDIVTEYNYTTYAQYIIKLIDTYSWVKYWQILTQPEEIIDDKFKCDPVIYVKMMQLIYDNISIKYSDIKLGGPGSFRAIFNYLNPDYFQGHSEYMEEWLKIAFGEYVGISVDETKGCNLPAGGLLNYIGFFSYQGNRNSNVFTYKNYVSTISAFKTAVVTSYRNSTSQNINLEFISLLQGHEGSITNKEETELQAFRDIREIMQDFKVGTIPCKKQLVDECTLTKANVYSNSYGILNASTMEQKSAYKQYLLLFNKLQDYTQVLTDVTLSTSKRPFDYTDEVEYTMFTNDDVTKILTVVYPSAERDVTATKAKSLGLVLKPGVNRVYYDVNNDTTELINYTEKYFYNQDFMLIEEEIKYVDDSEDAAAEAKLRMSQYNTAIKSLLEDVPSDYNKEVYDTNWYKLLRSIAIEYGESQYEKEILVDNMYLSTAHGDAIYNKFGIMIGVKKKRDWTYERYREIVSAIIESLLSGATKSSIQKVVSVYTGFDVTIYEMFKDYEHVGYNKEDNWDNQYKFTIEIERDLDSDKDTTEIVKDAKEVLNIVKPAHTLPIIMIVLSGDENYRDWYNTIYEKDFANSDEQQFAPWFFEESNQYGYRAIDYDFLLHTNSNERKIASNFKIAPKYTLYDREYWQYIDTKEEKYNTPQDKLLAHYKAQPYLDTYDLPITDDLTYIPSMTLAEFKYGLKPTLNDATLKYGGFIYDNDGNVIGAEGRITNKYKTGFQTFLKDKMNFEYTAWYADIYPKNNIKDNTYWIWKYHFNETYLTPQENVFSYINMTFDEFPYGYCYEKIMHTFSDRHTTTNNYHYAIKYRLNDAYNSVTLDGYKETISSPYARKNIFFNWKQNEIYNNPIIEHYDANITYKDKFNVPLETVNSNGEHSYNDDYVTPIVENKSMQFNKTFNDIRRKPIVNKFNIINDMSYQETFNTPSESMTMIVTPLNPLTEQMAVPTDDMSTINNVHTHDETVSTPTDNMDGTSIEPKIITETFNPPQEEMEILDNTSTVVYSYSSV